RRSVVPLSVTMAHDEIEPDRAGAPGEVGAIVDELPFSHLPRHAGRDELTPYAGAEEHLRDEIWRVWLRVEYEIRRRWEWEALPQVASEGGLGVWQPRDIAGMFRAAHVEYSGVERKRQDHGASTLLDAYLRHSAALETRVEMSLAA